MTDSTSQNDKNQNKSKQYAELSDTFVSHPDFIPVMQDFFKTKYAFNAEFPIVMRLISNREKSLISGILFSVWFEMLLAGRKDCCTMAAIAERAAKYNLLSQNTVKTMLLEFAAYGLLIRKVGPGNRKNKVIEVAPFVPEGLRILHDQTLAVIDQLLGTRRLEYHQTHRNDYLHAHLGVIENLATDLEWRRAVPSVALFYLVKYGSWVAEDLITRLQPDRRYENFYIIDNFNRTETGKKYGLSRSSVHRLFLAAEQNGLLKQSGDALLVSEGFVQDFLKSSLREILAFELAWQPIAKGNQT